MIELPLCAVRMIRIGSLPRRNTQNLDIKGMPLVEVGGLGLRPNASEISLPAPLNFPFGEDHVSSAIFVVLILRMTSRLSPNELPSPPKCQIPCPKIRKKL